MIWKLGQRAPYVQMNGYQALTKRDALLLACSEETLGLIRNELSVEEIPEWPRACVLSVKNEAISEG